MAGDRRLVLESPEMYETEEMKAYIAQEVSRPCKQWVHDVILSKREVERVKLRTDQFVLLPDADSLNKRAYSRVAVENIEKSTDPSTQRSPNQFRFNRNLSPTPGVCFSNQGWDVLPLHASRIKGAEFKVPPEPSASSQPTSDASQHPNSGLNNPTAAFLSTPSPPYRWRIRRGIQCLHWLAVVTDTQLKTIRDLKGHHLPMLQKLYAQCCHRIFEETGIAADQIMAYVHYPPSVYQLHIHFKHPVGHHMSHDTFRIHSLPTIINNLKIDPDYYSKSLLHLPVYAHTELYTALGLNKNSPALRDPDETMCAAVEFQTEA